MGRSKKTRGPEEILKSMHENSEEVTRPYIDVKSLSAEEGDLESVDESPEDVELADTDEDDADKTVEIDLNGKPKAKRAPRKRSRAAAPKKRKEPVELISDEITEVLEPPAPKAKEPRTRVKETVAETPVVTEPKLEEPITQVVAESTPPAPTPASTWGRPETLREDATITAAGLHKSMDSMVKQWTSVKEISGSICNELERVNTLLKSAPQKPDPVDVRDYLKQAAPRITLANKIALGVSAAAVVLSVVSLSLASSTRNTLLDKAISAPAALTRSMNRPAAPKATSILPEAKAEAPKAAVPETVVAAPIAPPEPPKEIARAERPAKAVARTRRSAKRRRR